VYDERRFGTAADVWRSFATADFGFRVFIVVALVEA
jgi:hypothetical protein